MSVFDHTDGNFVFVHQQNCATISLRLQNLVFESDIKHLSC